MEFNNLAEKPDRRAQLLIEVLRKRLAKKASGKAPVTPVNPKRL
jgi:hypothetical protein